MNLRTFENTTHCCSLLGIRKRLALKRTFAVFILLSFASIALLDSFHNHTAEGLIPAGAGLRLNEAEHQTIDIYKTNHQQECPACVWNSTSSLSPFSSHHASHFLDITKPFITHTEQIFVSETDKSPKKGRAPPAV